MSNHEQPLLGKRIVVTRAAGQADTLCDLLRESGAEPIELPLVSFRPLLTIEEAEPITNRLVDFDWIIFTSSNAIRFFFELMDGRKIPSDVRLACVGKKTAESLSACGRDPDFVPSQFSGQNLADEIEIKAGEKILYPCPEKTASDLAGALESRGGTVSVWPVYETISIKPAADALDKLKSGFDAITFASPSTVDSYCDEIGKQAATSKHCLVACIGPMTAQRARDRKMSVDVVPASSDIPSLVSALIHRFRSQVSGEAL